MEILRNSAVHCKYFDMKLPAMQNRDFTNPYFLTLGAFVRYSTNNITMLVLILLLQKDLSLIVKECKKLGMDTTAVEGITGLMEKAALKYPELDFASVYNIVNPQS